MQVVLYYIYVAGAMAAGWTCLQEVAVVEEGFRLDHGTDYMKSTG